jgi:hypothetical protein
MTDSELEERAEMERQEWLKQGGKARDTAAEIIATHRIVWQYRNKLERVWPTPGRIDSLRFAFTEAGEAMDAELRKVPQYARNNDRNMSVIEELADCAMMLCTALPEHYRFAELPLADFQTNLDSICFEVAETMLTGEVVNPLHSIAVFLREQYSASMATWVEARLKRIQRKVTPE